MNQTTNQTSNTEQQQDQFKLKKGFEVLYGLAGFGPNLMNLILGVYIINAFSVAGFSQHIENWTFFEKTIVVTLLFTVLVTIVRILDGVVDIPLAALSDKIRAKIGKRKMAMLLGLLPMIACFVLILFPLENQENSVVNTIYAAGLFLFFCVSYTLVLLNYYATFSTITQDVKQRAKLSSFKAFFDTIGYSLVYALIPLLIGFNLHIRTISLMVLPLVVTMLIPIFIVKEKSNRKSDLTAEEIKEADVPLIQQIKISFSNKNFIKWISVYAVFFLGLQIFLSGQAVIASGAMGFSGWQIAVMNSAAFAPIPLMLFIYYQVMRKRGYVSAFRGAIISFIIAMLGFFLVYEPWIATQWVRFSIALTASTIGSYGIGAFFMAPYLIVSQFAAADREKSQKDHAAMYFAVQGLFTAIAGALALGTWLTLKEINIEGQEFFGSHLALLVVMVLCSISLTLSYRLKNFFNHHELEVTKED